MTEPAKTEISETVERGSGSAVHASGGEKSRVFLVDDHTMFREGLRQLIEREPNMIVCGDAPDAAEAMRGIRATNPDVVLLDISLAGTSGIDLIKDIKTEF